MLPEPNRLHHHLDFSRTVRRGQRIGRRAVVVHVFDRAAGASSMSAPVLDVGQPRFGLIVSKSVGNAVVRHRVARRLRHICVEVREQTDADLDVVIRALPPAGAASSASLRDDVRSALSALSTRVGRQ